MIIIPAFVFLLQAATSLDNEYVRVSRNAAPCAGASVRCGDRVVVALGAVELRSRGVLRKLNRGQIAVFRIGESYEAPTTGEFFEVVIKPNHPTVAPRRNFIPPKKNTVLYDGDGFFVFEERLAVGDTRAKHSHRERVVIQLNRTRLQQWPEGQPEIVRDIEPDRAGFNPPVVHTVKNVGGRPLRGIVIEFKPARTP
jgi:hypothetical protein